MLWMLRIGETPFLPGRENTVPAARRGMVMPLATDP
jgi:hypothetical protein